MSKRLKKTIAVILAALMVISTCVIFASCGCDDKAKTSKSSQSSKTSSKKTSTQPATQQDETEDTQQSDDSGDGYVDEATAISKVREQAGSGAQIDNYYKGYAPDGSKAWVVTVIPVTTEDGPDSVVYYVNEGFCYTDDSDSSDTSDDTDDSDDSDSGYISEAKVYEKIREQAGTGAKIQSSEKGYAPDGSKAWVVTVIPITTADGPSTVTYYVNEGFCYIG